MLSAPGRVPGRRFPAALVLGLLAAASPVARAAERPLALRVRSLIFADNTEFFGPFRTGETLAGAWVRASLVWPLSDRASFDLGVAGREVFGSERAVEDVRPVVALRLGTDASRFVLGTLDPGRATTALGPDLQSPHGLLPPIQGETLSFERPWEAGFQWTGSTGGRSHDVWISWQRVNTAAHRERLNAGVTFEKAVRRLTVFGHAHVVHEGGQLHATGAVADSAAFAAGASARVWSHGPHSLTMLAAVSRAVLEPDRAVAGNGVRGRGVFLRAAYLRGAWRAHALGWHARDVIKVEGDANYGATRRDGTRVENGRNYFETGLAREFRAASGLRMEVSARLHAYAGEVDYSYRVLAAIDVLRRFGGSSEADAVSWPRTGAGGILR